MEQLFHRALLQKQLFMLCEWVNKDVRSGRICINGWPVISRDGGCTESVHTVHSLIAEHFSDLCSGYMNSFLWASVSSSEKWGQELS